MNQVTKSANKRQITIKALLNKIYGGLDTNWKTVILFAVGTAVLTSVLLGVPVFRDTSFERMGVYLESWIFFAVIIMANCKKPLESAIKTFVFFLISQPLIYFFQVPFSSAGWSIFGYYKYWFIWTLLTFPMAYIGWYITKKNWLSVLIFSPVLAFLGYTAYTCGADCLGRFPRMLLAALFCAAQIAIYIIAFFPENKQKIVGALIPVAAVMFFALTTPQVDLNATVFLPDDPVLTDNAIVLMDETEIGEIAIAQTGEDSMIQVQAHKYGTIDFTVKDGDNEYSYTAEVYIDDGGHPQINITRK